MSRGSRRASPLFRTPPAPTPHPSSGNLPKTQAEWEKEHPDPVWEEHRGILLPGYYEEWAAARKHPSGVVYKAVVGVTGDGTNDAPALKVRWKPQSPCSVCEAPR